MPRLLSIAAALALVACVLNTSGAAAASGRCEKRGYGVLEKTSNYVVLGRNLKQKSWVGGPTRMYVCGLRYGKLYQLGDFGSDDEGYSEYLGETMGTSRYFAYVTGQGNADAGDTDHQIVLLDLKSRKVLMSRTPQRGGGGGSVTAIALTSRGNLGWIARTTEDNPELGGPKSRDVSQIYLRKGSSATLVASRPEIDPKFLRFDQDGKSLIWSTSTESVAAN